ncbi:hypothetical protein EVAR_68348_1 [Eumeta japonica]|uniref:Uncharacterized protein n=1 Tax=Eumeta variegata TaxID=151549 RepID=A0A4C1SEM9_EUMVA|nr:hypothetical protein EVAR_68348_1 [Eumeta japonica]
MAQRPSFAGSRPPNGLNQKDKYHPQPSPNTVIENRFGNANVSIVSSQIPYGQPQKPPVGYPVVLPELIYTVLKPTKSTVNNKEANLVIFDDRFGNTKNNNMSAIAPSSTTERSGFPLDAHGDLLLIDQLNRTPVDKRPFWFINYQAIEAQRNGSSINSATGQGSRSSFLG